MHFSATSLEKETAVLEETANFVQEAHVYILRAVRSWRLPPIGKRQHTAETYNSAFFVKPAVQAKLESDVTSVRV